MTLLISSESGERGFEPLGRPKGAATTAVAKKKLAKMVLKCILKRVWSLKRVTVVGICEKNEGRAMVSWQLEVFKQMRRTFRRRGCLTYSYI